MPTIKKITLEKGYSEPTIDNDSKSYADDPFFVEKAAKAKERVSKLKFPDHLKK